MVRLKVDYGQATKVKSKFQFQNGAIKRRCSIFSIAQYLKFQFQNGAIKSAERFCSRIPLFVFQFQNGAIKRSVDLYFVKA